MIDSQNQGFHSQELIIYEGLLLAFLNVRLLQEFYEEDGCVLWVEKINISVDY